MSLMIRRILVRYSLRALCRDVAGGIVEPEETLEPHLSRFGEHFAGVVGMEAIIHDPVEPEQRLELPGRHVAQPGRVARAFEPSHHRAQHGDAVIVPGRRVRLELDYDGASRHMQRDVEQCAIRHQRLSEAALDAAGH